ncbi:hypothetical protein HY449_01035 [Candidatus Pacearchaeota archaeon]|nr:hypothetical protein [Candidatus Pacearchaeota archaeon]
MTDYRVFRVIDGNSERIAGRGYHQASAQRIREEARLSPEEYFEVARKIRNLPIHTSYQDKNGLHYFLRDGGRFITNPEQGTVIGLNVDERIFRFLLKIKSQKN